MSKPAPGLIFYIVNRRSEHVWDLSLDEKTFVVGSPPNGQDSQKWRFDQLDGFWIIQNVSNLDFANVDPANPVKPGAKVVTAIPRTWELNFDETLLGWRITIPGTKLNAELFPSKPESSIIIAEEKEDPLQIWILKDAK